MEHLEGRQAVLAALQARQRRINVVLLAHGAHIADVQEILDQAQAADVPIRFADRRELDTLAHGATHGGVMAVASAKPRWTLEQLCEHLDSRKEPPLLLLLEGIDDARNLGFAIRSAEALGAHAILVKKHLWDLDPIEVARPSSGAYERLPLVQIDQIDALIQLQRRGLRLYGCLAGARRTLYDVNLTIGVILAIGGEKRGLSGAVRKVCDRFITIPTGQGASLSMSHASAIVLAEAMRQRRVATTGDESE
jgi:23S rRNA (guanosine2251-2'-O)-methyltransferase